MVRPSSSRSVSPAAAHRHADRPVYREVLTHAFRTAWHDRRFWPLAFFASLLLTGGTYDVLLKAFTEITEQGTWLSASAITWSGVSDVFRGSLSGLENILQLASGVQAVLAVALLLLALAAVSCAAQGGLVYALGAVHRGNRPTLGEALRVGGGAFWPILALNAIVLATLWILRFLAALPLFIALDRTTASHWLLYVFSFLVFVALVFITNIIQIFALNSMILQGSPVHDALRRAYTLFKKHWIIAVETALILTVLAAGMSILFIGLYFLLMVPLIASVIAAAVLQSQWLLYGTMSAGIALLIFGIFVVTSFMTQLQYATWVYLYRRLGEGGVLPKLHRFVRALTGSYSVPQR